LICWFIPAILGALAFGEVHQQRIEGDDLDRAADPRHLAADDRHPFLDREHRRFGGIGGDADHQPVDQLRAAPDDVHMPQSDGVEGAGIDADPLCHVVSLQRSRSTT
jgi:hypothetical protein